MQDSRQVLDPVRPGEQWFCYWKTSASLWESRIQDYSNNEIIFIPLYWGFHAEENGTWDFGKYHPERDLVRLISLLTQHGRRFCWLLPITPAPFLPNGGLPISAARTLSVSTDGIHIACLDQDSTLHKMYSFFEPKVIQSFASFVQAFGEMLSQSKAKFHLWGVEFSYFEKKYTTSFLEDSSVCFEQGFSRYLRKNYPDGIELNQVDDEKKIKTLFLSDMRNLMISIAQDALAPYWNGIQSITVLGSSPKDTIERSLETGKSQTHFFKDLFESYISHSWFSTCLLNSKEKKDLIKNCLDEHFASDEIEYRYNYQTESTDLSEDFRPFALIDIFDHYRENVFKDNGLKNFIQKNFQWMYHEHQNLDFSPQWIDRSHHRLKFFHADGMERVLFTQMLKLFMMGQKIILDVSCLSDELVRRLEVFYLENNLKVQSINYLTAINICELGEGRFITFEGQKLQSEDDKDKFWGHLFKFLNLDHPLVELDKDIFALWRIRSTSPYELNYLDVRRVNFYNPTSYKKLVSIHTQKKFAFMKVIDPLHALAKTTTEGVEIELLPNGKLGLEFGHYEEKK